MTVIENAYFDEAKQQDAIDAAQQGYDRFSTIPDAISSFTRKEMEKKYPQEWQCICSETSEKPEDVDDSKQYICIKFDDCYVHLWTENEEDVGTQLANTNLTEDKIKTLFAKYDKSGNGKLEFDEFLKFMKDGLGFEPNLKQMRFLYDGMDTDGSHNLDQSEVIECLIKFRENDFKWITKMIFRGADKDKSRKVSILELSDACDSLCRNNFEQQCEIEFGKKKTELEYWEFYKLISGETLDKKSIDADPYDGKLPQKSKCCLLL